MALVSGSTFFSFRLIKVGTYFRQDIDAVKILQKYCSNQPKKHEKRRIILTQKTVAMLKLGGIVVQSQQPVTKF